jgi:hypothetical protein
MKKDSRGHCLLLFKQKGLLVLLIDIRARFIMRARSLQASLHGGKKFILPTFRHISCR